jgi:histidinol-phosphate aminotransferase
MSHFSRLTTEKIRQLTPYQPGKPIKELQRELGIKSVIKLASNENPLGTSAYVSEAISRTISEVNLYPDGSCFELKETLAKSLSINANQLTIGNGSDEIFRLILQAFAQNTNDTPTEVICSEYAFAAFPIAALAYGCQIKRVDCPNFVLDIAAIPALVTPQTRVVYIDNPCNPLGSAISHHQLVSLLQKLPSSVLVLLDEAYYDYVAWSDYPRSIPLLAQFPNLIITRTFSKAYGLAGLRIGYSISHPDIAEILNRIRLPFNNNSVAQAAAKAALEDTQHLEKSIALVHQEKPILEQFYHSINFKPLPSYGNFITVDLGQSGIDIYQKLLLCGIIVRPVDNYNLKNCLRITIGLPEENLRLMTELTKISKDLSK